MILKTLFSISIGIGVALIIGSTVNDRVDAIYPRIVDEGKSSRVPYLAMIAALGGLTGGVISR